MILRQPSPRKSRSNLETLKGRSLLGTSIYQTLETRNTESKIRHCEQTKYYIVLAIESVSQVKVEKSLNHRTIILNSV